MNWFLSFFKSSSWAHKEGYFPSYLTSVSRSASSEWTLVLREVRATLMSVSLSISWVTFSSSRTARAFSLAASKPSATILGWRPCSTKSKHECIKHKVQEMLMKSGKSVMALHGTVASQPHLWHVEVSLLQQFTDDEDVGGGSVSCDVILRRGNLSNQRRCWVLNLLKNKQVGIKSLRGNNPYYIGQTGLRLQFTTKRWSFSATLQLKCAKKHQ